jgi:hypothetical protein
MATTFGSISFSNGQVVGIAQTTNGAVGSKLPVDINRAVTANTNNLDFQVNSPARIVDWESGAIASGAVEIYSNDRPTGAVCNLVNANIAKTNRMFPKPVLVPGRTYSIRVVVVLPA